MAYRKERDWLVVSDAANESGRMTTDNWVLILVNFVTAFSWKCFKGVMGVEICTEVDYTENDYHIVIWYKTKSGKGLSFQ